MTIKELIDQYVTAHANNRWMDASELEALLTEFAEKVMANQPKTREVLFREYMQATPAERRKFDLSFLDETRKEALAILTDLGYECKLPVEPASEDLERAANRYADNTANLDARETRYRGFTAGAQWQREQMQLTWQDIQRIFKIADQMVDEDEDGKLITIGEEGYYQMVLDKWKEIMSE